MASAHGNSFTLQTILRTGVVSLFSAHLLNYVIVLCRLYIEFILLFLI